MDLGWTAVTMAANRHGCGGTASKQTQKVSGGFLQGFLGFRIVRLFILFADFLGFPAALFEV